MKHKIEITLNVNTTLPENLLNIFIDIHMENLRSDIRTTEKILNNKNKKKYKQASLELSELLANYIAKNGPAENN